MLQIVVKKDGDRLKFKRGKDEVEAVVCDDFVLVTCSKDGSFSVDSNSLGTQDLIGRLELALVQARQDFISRNYGAMVLQPEAKK